MSIAPEIKYTDRDVREDGRLAGVAVNYVIGYGGEFEPLVEAKEYYEEHGELTTGLIRKVLNCMRHDSKYIGQLPTPRRRIVEPDKSDPDPFRPRRRKKKPADKFCGKLESHDTHPGKTYEDGWCPGVPWVINRPYNYRVGARVKLPYAAARQGNFIHLTAGHGYSVWHPKPHEWGWRQVERYRFQVPTDRSWDFYVKLRCKNPSVLKNPVLLDYAEMVPFLENAKKLRSPNITICPKCLPPPAGS